MNHAEAFLYDQVPPSLRHFIPTTLKLAYAAADRIVSGEQVLQVPSARDNRGRIVQWCVDFGFQGLIKSGQWPFDYRWEWFAVPTGRFLEIRPSHSVLTISQVAEADKQPRDVKFRANKRLHNQPWLRELPNPFDDGMSFGVPHILLVHGHQDLTFAHLGIPSAMHHRGYEFQTRNLLKMPHEQPAPEPELPPENTDIEAVMTLKEEIDRWRKDNGIE